MTEIDTTTIALESGRTVSAIFQAPPRPTALLVLAHGAGAGMTHPFMSAVAERLSARTVATLRYQFPFMEAGLKRPDPPAMAKATVRAAVAAARDMAPDLPLFAGGKSFGGRMTSQAQAEAPLDGVSGLVFLGFPLHPAGKPSTKRADHLESVEVPMLFLQGSRDILAERALIESTTAALGPRAILRIVDEADHSFHVPKRSGRLVSDVMDQMLDATLSWMHGIAVAR